MALEKFLQIHHLGKKFRKEWIFKNVTFKLALGETMVITGQNGSGKSTLLKVISGILPPTEGRVSLILGKKMLADDFIFSHLNWTAPYIELPEELTVREAVEFHGKFKKLELTTEHIIERAELTAAAERQIKFLSSGMKQKLKLSLVFFSEAKILLLDEPTVNLDKKNTAWYLQNIRAVAHNRMTIIASNIPEEYSFCENHLNITDFKA
jgi:ABC-type multidrug transport system ATPase subunit